MKKPNSKTVRLPVYCEHNFEIFGSTGQDFRHKCMVCGFSCEGKELKGSKVQIGWVEVPK